MAYMLAAWLLSQPVRITNADLGVPHRAARRVTAQELTWLRANQPRVVLPLPAGPRVFMTGTGSSLPAMRIPTRPTGPSVFLFPAAHPRIEVEVIKR